MIRLGCGWCTAKSRELALLRQLRLRVGGSGCPDVTRLGLGQRRLLAERGGFEPPDPVSQVNSLAVSPIRPLSHLSVTSNASRPLPPPHASPTSTCHLIDGAFSLGVSSSTSRLELEMRLPAPATTTVTKRVLGQRLQHRRIEVHEVLSRYGLSNPRIFGSVARGEETPESDVDLLVDIPEGVGLMALGRCQAGLEALLGAPVDLIPSGDLKASVAAEVLAEAQAL